MPEKPTERISVAGPWITAKEVSYVADAAANAWYGNARMYNDRFERAFAEYTGTRYAVSLPSCTSAIHLALAALGIGPTDEVIVPDVTWIASAAPITYVGATPVFADIDAKNWCLSPESVEGLITPQTRAILAVDLYGNMAEMDALRSISRQHCLALIEDAAEAIGGEYKGRRAGSLGDIGVFSFHGSKTLTTGEGGMLVTDNREVYDRIQVLRDHGRKPGDRMFFNTEIAFKYKMSSVQAALGLAQLERVGELIEQKRRLFRWYEEALSGIEGLSLNHEAPGTRSSYWMVTVVLAPSFEITKNRLMELLSTARIDTRPFFHPLSSLPAYEGSRPAADARRRNRVSYAVSASGINLPSGFNMDQDKVKYVCRSLRDILMALSSAKSVSA
ncbi:MAG TPA: DegT/DnrJ/EryC1/StrS family aminotransferase [Acidobacteriota bacterium]|nr:DegT/DnrJ/EryC1/StrS family aminotransferase [Acidobacteriota bacterium]